MERLTFYIFYCYGGNLFDFLICQLNIISLIQFGIKKYMVFVYETCDNPLGRHQIAS
jgi:hypothetical protein